MAQKFLVVALNILKNAPKNVEIFRLCLRLELMTMEQKDVTPTVAHVIAKHPVRHMAHVAVLPTMVTGCIHTFKKIAVRYV